ncbi:MAG: hypothetical protein M0C28_18470 [Candidatus Moduliflexus flocculans]|nr:hypothetical protein [Candidatus Moduliflexus flocculans]
MIAAARGAGVEVVFVQHGEGPGSDMEKGTRELGADPRDHAEPRRTDLPEGGPVRIRRNCG